MVLNNRTYRYGYIVFFSDAGQEYMYFIGSETSPLLRYTLLTKIIVPSEEFLK